MGIWRAGLSPDCYWLPGRFTTEGTEDTEAARSKSEIRMSKSETSTKYEIEKETRIGWRAPRAKEKLGSMEQSLRVKAGKRRLWQIDLTTALRSTAVGAVVLGCFHDCSLGGARKVPHGDTWPVA